VHTTINQISFRVPDLEALRQYYPWLVKERVNKLDPRNHGNAWSIYFADPEGNRVELYCSSPWHVSQPFGEPLDLTESADAIRAKTEALVKQDPTCQPMDTWVAQMKKKMSAQTIPAWAAREIVRHTGRSVWVQAVPGPCFVLAANPDAARAWPVWRVDDLATPASGVGRIAISWIATVITAVIAGACQAEPEAQANGRTAPTPASTAPAGRSLGGRKCDSDDSRSGNGEQHLPQ
jgi:hypothetical protein